MPLLTRSGGPGRIATLLAQIERRPILSIFLVALAVRVIAAVVIAIGWNGSLFLDDASYSQLAEMAADGAVRDPYLDFLYERTATLLVPIAGLYKLFGPVELLGQLYVALLGAATAALTARLAMEVVSRRWALLAGLIVAVLPSQILWSSLILKDAAVWAVLSALALAVAISGRTGGRRLALLGIAVALLLALLGFLRLHTLEIACVAILLAVLLSPRQRPLLRMSGATVLLVCIPLAFGMGVAGATFVIDSRDPAQQRAANASLAETAVVDVPAPPPPAAPPLPDQAPKSDKLGSLDHPGSSDKPDSQGTSDKPDAPEAPASLDTPPLSDTASAPTDDTSPVNDLAYLPTGVTVVALRPWPWESSSSSLGIRLARAETILWYPLLLLALVGLTGVWRHRRVLAFPALAGAAILVTYGLTEGNLGTAYRHRGEFVWIVALLATVGAERVVAWRRERASARPA